jgi:hypothetical protein
MSLKLGRNYVSTIAQLHLVYLCYGETESSTGRVVALKLSQRSWLYVVCRGSCGRVRRVMSLKLGRNYVSTIAQLHLVYLYFGETESSTGRVVALKLSKHSRFYLL